MNDPQPAATTVPSTDDLPTRWEIELEFVQSLANTQYISYLAQSGFLKDQKFLNYLNYLNYWKDPKFSKFLVYPNCLHILTLLQNENFRNELLNQNFTNLLYNDMLEYWKEPLFDDEKEVELEKLKDREKKSITSSDKDTFDPNSSSSPDKLKSEQPSNTTVPTSITNKPQIDGTPIAQVPTASPAITNKSTSVSPTV